MRSFLQNSTVAIIVRIQDRFAVNTAVVCLAAPEVVHDNIATSTVTLITCITLTVHWRLAAACQCRRQDTLEYTDQSLAQWRQGGNQYTERELSLRPDCDIDTIPGRILGREDRSKLHSLEDRTYCGTTLRISAADATKS